MKMITAMIKPHLISLVKRELFFDGFYQLTITNVVGSGQQAGDIDSDKKEHSSIRLHRKARIEIAAKDDQVEKIVDAIIRGARTGSIGDGKIFISPIENCIRIRTEESGPSVL